MKRKCICCGCITSHHLHYKKTKRNRESADSFSPTASDFGIFYDLLICEECGHVSAETKSKKILSKYNQADETGDYFECATFREKSMRQVLARLAGSVFRKKTRILDVGAGGGIFLNLLNKLGYEGHGIEPSHALCRKAYEKYSISLRQGVLREKLPNDKTFDLITLWEVIEHFSSPNHEIKKISSHLDPLGKILIATPNVQSLSARILGPRWWSYREMHLHYFSPNSLETLMRRFGFFKVYESRFQKTFPIWYFLSKVLPIPNCLKKTLHAPLHMSLGDMVHLYEKRGIY